MKTETLGHVNKNLTGKNPYKQRAFSVKDDYFLEKRLRKLKNFEATEINRASAESVFLEHPENDNALCGNTLSAPYPHPIRILSYSDALFGRPFHDLFG